MSIFLLPNNAIPFYYFFIPQAFQYQNQKTLPHDIETPSTQDAEILKPILEQRQKILLTKEDLQTKGYQQNKKPWTQKEDKLLLRLCEDQNSRFEDIAKLIPGRNAKMCYSRYRRLTNQVKQSWTQQQNHRLRALVSQLGQNWKQIVPFFKKRNDKQLKDHYLNYLRPNLNKSQWSVQEDLILISLINRFGKNWKLIQQNMPDRSRNQIKNRYFGRIKRIDEQKKNATIILLFDIFIL